MAWERGRIGVPPRQLWYGDAATRGRTKPILNRTAFRGGAGLTVGHQSGAAEPNRQWCAPRVAAFYNGACRWSADAAPLWCAGGYPGCAGGGGARPPAGQRGLDGAAPQSGRSAGRARAQVLPERCHRGRAAGHVGVAEWDALADRVQFCRGQDRARPRPLRAADVAGPAPPYDAGPAGAPLPGRAAVTARPRRGGTRAIRGPTCRPRRRCGCLYPPGPGTWPPCCRCRASISWRQWRSYVISGGTSSRPIGRAARADCGALRRSAHRNSRCNIRIA